MARALYAFFAALLFGAMGAAHAQSTYPDRRINLVVPFGPGGSTDVIGRLIAQALETQMGVSVVVQNQPGGGATIGAAFVSRAEPDGYTLLVGTPNQTINVSMADGLKFDFIKDFKPVSQVAESVSVLLVNKNVPEKTASAFIASARSNPGKFSYASSGVGSTAHLTTELFKHEAGVDIVHVPYSGASKAMTDAVAGRVEMLFGFPAGAMSFIESKELIPLGVTSKTRLTELPDIPTMAEIGLPAMNVVAWYGILAPANTPDPVVAKLNAEIAKAVEGLATRFAEIGVRGVSSSPAEFKAFLEDDVERWATAVKFSNAKASK